MISLEFFRLRKLKYVQQLASCSLIFDVFPPMVNVKVVPQIYLRQPILKAPRILCQFVQEIIHKTFLRLQEHMYGAQCEMRFLHMVNVTMLRDEKKRKDSTSASSNKNVQSVLHLVQTHCWHRVYP